MAKTVFFIVVAAGGARVDAGRWCLGGRHRWFVPVGYVPSCSRRTSVARGTERRRKSSFRVGESGCLWSSRDDKDDEDWVGDFGNDAGDTADLSREFARFASQQEEQPQPVASEPPPPPPPPPAPAEEDADLSGCVRRQFRLGYDIQLTRFAGSMGFDEVTDWEYYLEDVEEGDDADDYDSRRRRRRQVVQPSPLDSSKPRRTRESSGSVVRLFLGELSGRLGGSLRARGSSNFVVLKEFSGDLALDLARSELQSVSIIQTALCRARSYDFAQSAAMRYILGRANGITRQDDSNVDALLSLLSNPKFAVPHVGILGQLNLDDFGEIDANEWYRVFKVKPPEKGSIWLVYEYVGLYTLATTYGSKPPLLRLKDIPPKRGFFGNIIPPPSLPSWDQRASYLIKGILKRSLQALASLHESGVAHRSIGRTSIIVSSLTSVKAEASMPFASSLSNLVVKLADFGFSCPLRSILENDDQFVRRAQTFGLDLYKLRSDDAVEAFAKAEDFHALGYVFVGVLLTALAEVPSDEFVMPSVDEDSLKRQLVDIFNKDINEFREYCDAEAIWDNLVQLLDEKDGWELLETMCFARERTAQSLMDGMGSPITAQELLQHPLLSD